MPRIPNRTSFGVKLPSDVSVRLGESVEIIQGLFNREILRDMSCPDDTERRIPKEITVVMSTCRQTPGIARISHGFDLMLRDFTRSLRIAAYEIAVLRIIPCRRRQTQNYRENQSTDRSLSTNHLNSEDQRNIRMRPKSGLIKPSLPTVAAAPFSVSHSGARPLGKPFIRTDAPEPVTTLTEPFSR